LALSRQRPFFYGWVITFASAFGLAVGVSGFIPAATGLLVAPLRDAFGWTPPQVLFALSFTTLMAVPAAPLTGVLVDRFGARRVIAISFLAEAVIIASLRYLDEEIGWFYARYAALAMFCTGTTAVAFSAVISRWFDQRRGLALGIALAGVGVGGAVWSLVTQALFDSVGWRDAFLYMGAFIAVVILPTMVLTLRDSPEAIGEKPDGRLVSDDLDTRRARSLSGFTLTAAIRDRRYWWVLITFFLVACVTYGVQLNLVTIMRAEGATAQTAAAAQASIWAAMVFGRLTTGWLMDRFFAPRVALAFLVPCALGAVMLALDARGPAAFVAAMLVGVATGAEGDVLAYVLGRYFGLKNFSAIYATQFALYAIGSSTGPVALSWAAARTGTYGAALMGLAAVVVIAMVLLLRLPRFYEQPDDGG
jgi:sugar phosphate permease